MRKRNKSNKIFALVLILLGITIGYAALSTTLKINGTTNIGKNTWDVYWDNLGNISKSSSVTVISDAEIDKNDNEKIDFEIKLNNPGDYYEFQVDAVNNGTLDAMTSIVSTVINDDETASLPPYITYTIKYVDGVDVGQYHLLKKKTNDVATTERFKVRIEFSSNTTEQQLESIGENVSYDMDIQLPYVQADDHAIDKPMPPAVNFATDSWAIIAYAGNNAAKQTSVTDDACGSVYHVGDTRQIDMGSLGTHTVRIANCSTPAVCSSDGFSQTACGFVLEFADVITTHKMNLDGTSAVNGYNNTGGWKYSDMRAFVNSSVFATNSTDYATTGVFDKLPSDLKDQIANTKSVSGYGVNDASNGNFVVEDDKLFLLSIHEVFEDADSNPTSGMNANDSAWDYTRQLDYYTGSDSSNYGTFGTKVAITKKYNGTSSANWWTRTANSKYYYYFYVVADGGGWRNTENYGTANGVSPAFKLK